MNVFITAGGTGGHIFPGLALYEVMREAGEELFFVGGERDRRFDAVRRLGNRHIVLPGAPLDRKKLHKNFRTLWLFFKALRRSLSLIRSLKPDVCVGMGGYSTAPLLLACRLKSVPYLLCEQNAYPGFVNRCFASGAAKILLTFAEAADHFRKKIRRRTEVSGNSVRAGFGSVGHTEALTHFGLKRGDVVLGIMGGSQGAARINAALSGMQKKLGAVSVIWSCGVQQYPEIRKKVHARNFKLYPFVERMDLFLEAADLVVSRAGATSLSELVASGTPAVLVPYPFAAADHQTANARSFEKAGAAIVVPEGEAFESRLEETLVPLLKDRKKIKKMASGVSGLFHKDAMARIMAAVYTAAGQKDGQKR